MKRMALYSIVALFALMAPMAALADGCNCQRPPDGYVVCQASCSYPNYCVYDSEIQPTNYCYYDTIGVCFNGGYDPCCDPDCIGPF